MPVWIDVAAAVDIAPGSYQLVDVDDRPVAVFNVDGEFFALEDSCSHDQNTLTGGCIDGDQIECPRHGARFCIRTGEALTPPAYEALQTFSVRIQNGVVQVAEG